MPEELKKSIDPSAYRMNYSLSNSSDTPVMNAVVTSSDLLEDGNQYEEAMRRRSAAASFSETMLPGGRSGTHDRLRQSFSDRSGLAGADEPMMPGGRLSVSSSGPYDPINPVADIGIGVGGDVPVQRHPSLSEKPRGVFLAWSRLMSHANLLVEDRQDF